MDENVIYNLINTIISDNEAAYWSDSEIIEKLIKCGLTEQDFVKYGFGDFVEDYFKSNKIIYKCKHCGELLEFDADDDEDEMLWAHIQLGHPDIFERDQNLETPDMIEENYILREE